MTVAPVTLAVLIAATLIIALLPFVLVAIIGGGLVGSSAALALRRKGADVGSELTIAQLDSAINKVLNDRLRRLRHHFSPLHFSSIHSRRTLATVLSWRAA